MLSLTSSAPVAIALLLGGAISAGSAAVLAQSAASPNPAPHSAVVFRSLMGNKCLSVDLSVQNGDYVFGRPCSSVASQRFEPRQDRTLRWGALCVTARGGLGLNGDSIAVMRCDGGANQHWRWHDGEIHGMNNRCVDLAGGYEHWADDQAAILYDCNGGDNQRWSVTSPKASSAMPSITAR